MDKYFAISAIHDDMLFNSIQHHRSIYTSVKGVDYTKDFREKMVLIPPDNVLAAWEADYNDMCATMIYGDKLSYDTLLKRIELLQKRFRE